MKWVCMILAALLLTGCSEPESFETMSDHYVEETRPQAQETSFWLPQGAALMTSTTETGAQLYECEGFTAWTQVFASGDLDATLQAVTGQDPERIQRICRKSSQGQRSECAWACAGETGDQVARTLVVDDGYYHYTLTVMAPAQNAADLALTWQDMFQSFRLGEKIPQK